MCKRMDTGLCERLVRVVMSKIRSLMAEEGVIIKGHIRAPHNLCHPISCKLGKWLMTLPSTCVGSYRLLVAAVFPDSSGETNHSLMSVISMHSACSVFRSCESVLYSVTCAPCCLYLNSDGLFPM